MTATTPDNVLLAGIVGSTAYGLAGPDSDIDRLGVFAAPTRPCRTCGATDRYPSGGCRPCSKRRNAANTDYHLNRNRRRREAQIESARQESVRTGHIYGLAESGSELIRYVGQTQRGLRRRLSGHLHGHKGPNAHLPVNRWIAKLHAAGQEPEMRPLEGPLHVADLDEAEQRHIAELRAVGADLLNLCPGGRASLGTWSTPDEAIRRSAEAKRGKPRSPETRAKLSAANRGKKATPEAIAKRTARTRGRKQSPGWVAKRMEAVARTKAGKPRPDGCPNGHAWTEANTYLGRRGRTCRTCARERAKRDRAVGKRRYVPKPRAPRPRVRDVILAGVSREQEFGRVDLIQLAPGMSDQALYLMLSDAARDRLIVRVRRGVYRLADQA